MARPDRRLSTNVDGDLYVDDSCIDCGTCRWMARATFDRASGASRVHAQPADAAQRARAHEALIACPTASIGTATPAHSKTAAASLPRALAGGEVPGTVEGPGWRVLHCGFHSEESFGAASWLLVQDDGPNVLVDSPRYVRRLADAVEALGGVDLMFLTHRDDVADHARWHDRFGCARVIHEGDAAAVPGAEQVISGLDPVDIAAGITVVPTPGHTRGSACLAFGPVLFTGDTLAWSPSRGHVHAFRGACWYRWDVLIESVGRLAEHCFEVMLPGHGWPVQRTQAGMAEELQRCLRWMRRS